MLKTIGIIDEPVQPGAQDKLDINAHADSLIDFISATGTPITIGIQGEWGSGKTSLLNTIYHHFESKSDFKQIWINSWESSLLSTPEESLLKIINEIIEELLSADSSKSKSESIKNSAATVFKGALRIGATATLGLKAGEVAEELLSSQENSIKSLRNKLKELVLEIRDRATNPINNVIIYVDDLDRIEPKNAVAVLELLKNIFNVPNCIFVLAIDYQVVVKGLEHKFGKQTAENEWEFRAFFDKIIQLPFMMPMGQYNIGKYVNALLGDIGFIEGEGLEEVAVENIINKTIGGNPRSIKRLVNSVSLIQIFINKGKLRSNKKYNEEEKLEIDEDDQKFLMFALVCLQIAFPAIYSLLNKKPNFASWNDMDAFLETKRSEEDKEGLFEREFNNAKQTDDFNEEWEQALFKICYVRPRLRSRVTDISKFFSFIKDDLLSDNQDLIGESIKQILIQTSVTSVESTDQVQTSFQSKVVNSKETEVLNLYRTKYINAIKNAGSKIYGSVNPGKSFAWYMNTKAKKESFSNPNFLPRWGINFFFEISIRLDGDGPEQHEDFIRYCEKSIPNLEKKLGNDYGTWSVFYKPGVLRKQLIFHVKEGLIIDLPDGEIKWEDQGSIIAKNVTSQEKSIKWAEHCVPVFEKIIIELCEKYISEGDEDLISIKNYGG